MRAPFYISAVLCAAALCGCGRREPPGLPPGVSVESRIPQGVSWASLLRAAADLSTLTELPPPGSGSRLFSSSADTNKACLAHLAPEVLGDLDHGFFLRVEDVAGGVEATLAEADGPGAITWIWSANPVGQAVLYLDGRDEPALHMPFRRLLEGRFLPVAYPFAALTAHGHNLHFPIVHSSSFRLAVRARNRQELAELFYHVAWNSLDGRRDIRPFDIASVQASPRLLGSLAERLLRPSAPRGGCETATARLSVPPGQAKTFFDTESVGEIRMIEIRADGKEDLRGLWIEARWDGEPYAAVSCPMSLLAGTSPLIEDTESLPCTVSGPLVILRWPMPFGAGSELSCLNRGSEPRSVSFRVLFDPRQADRGGSPLRFHARRTRLEGLSLTERNMVSLGEPAGPGRIVGCALQVDSRSSAWWGEGDELIWLDGLDEPAWRGTGTEDYFGFAWCSDIIFDHPFRGQTRADGSRTGRRIAAMHRYHLLDRLPFQATARFVMEAWGLADGFMDYECALTWYGMPGTPLSDTLDFRGSEPVGQEE